MQVHARLGEVLYIYANSLGSGDINHQLQSSIQYFCRSIELCDDYLRGFYGLALVGAPCPYTFVVNPRCIFSAIQANTTLKATFRFERTSVGSFTGRDKFRNLHGLAKKNLEAIINTQYSLAPHLREYEDGELLSTKNLLSRLS